MKRILRACRAALIMTMILALSIGALAGIVTLYEHNYIALGLAANFGMIFIALAIFAYTMDD